MGIENSVTHFYLSVSPNDIICNTPSPFYYSGDINKVTCKKCKRMKIFKDKEKKCLEYAIKMHYNFDYSKP